MSMLQIQRQNPVTHCTEWVPYEPEEAERLNCEEWERARTALVRAAVLVGVIVICGAFWWVYCCR